MEEILHYLWCIKPCKYIMGNTTYQLVQDLFRQQYYNRSKVLIPHIQTYLETHRKNARIVEIEVNSIPNKCPCLCSIATVRKYSVCACIYHTLFQCRYVRLSHIGTSKRKTQILFSDPQSQQPSKSKPTKHFLKNRRRIWIMGITKYPNFQQTSMRPLLYQRPKGIED